MAFQDIGIRLVVMGSGEFRRSMTSARADLQGLSTEITKLSGTSSSLGNTLTLMGSSFMRTGQLLTTHLTIPIALLGGALIAAGIQFEDAFAGVSKTVDGVSDDMGNLTADGLKLREQFRQLALEIPISVNELARIGELGGQLGITKSELKDFTETVALLGVTTEMTSEDAATFFARLGNIMGVSADQMAEFTKQAGSTVVDLGNKFAATEPEIAALSLRLAGAGQAAGLSTPQILALATAMASMGIQAEMGGSAVSRILLETKRAVDDFTATGGQASTQLELFAKAAGMTVAEFVAMQKSDPNEVFLRLVDGFNRMSQAGEISNDVLKDMNLDTIRLQDVLNRLGPNIELVRQAMVTANDEWRTQDALQIEAQKRFNTTKSQLLLLRNAVVNLGIELFYLVSKPLNALIAGLRITINGFTKLNDGVLKSAMKIALLAAAVGPLLSVMGALMSVMGLFTKILSASSATLLGTQLAFGTILRYAALLGAAVAVLSYLWKSNFMGIRETVERVSGVLSEVIGWLGKAREAATNFPGADSLSGLIKAGLGVKAVFEALTYVYEDNKRTFFGEVIKAFGVGEETANKLGMAIRNFVTPAFTALGNGISYTAWVIDGFIKSVKDFGLGASIEGMFKVQEGSGLSWIGRIAIAFGVSETAAKNFSKSLESVFNFIKDFASFFAPVLVPLGKLVAGFWALSTAFGFLKAIPLVRVFRPLLGLLGPLASLFSMLAPLIAPLLIPLAALVAVFAAIKLNLFGMGDLFDTVVYWIKIFYSNLVNLTNVDELLGAAFSSLLSGDFEGAWENLKGAFESFSQFLVIMKPVYEQALNDIKEAFLTVLGNIGNWIKTDVLPAVSDALTAVGSWVVENAPVMVEKLKEWGQAFIDWVAPYIPKLLDALGNLAKDALKWIEDQLPGVEKKLETWGKAFSEWLADAVPEFLGELNDFVGRIYQWLLDELPGIVEKLAEWGTEFIDWVSVAAEDLLPKLAYFLGKLTGWIAGTMLPYLIAEGPILMAKFLLFITNAIIEVGPKLLEFASKLLVFFHYTLPRILADTIIAFGKGIVDGMKKGIEDNWDNFKSWLTDQVGSLKDTILSTLGVDSPSKFMIFVGEKLVEGFYVGIEDALPMLATAVQDMLDTVDSTFNVTAGGKLGAALANTSTTYNNTSSSSRTNIFSPTINGAQVSGERAVGDEIARVYRMATLGS